ncbi:hypothetical protein PQX77_021692 [Marasmius sp. AFHP31]|nr:hypothetical protein PQX77_021692 [Marasmius sp. AFHP31]
MPDQKSLVLERKQGPLVVSTRPIPKPGPGELLVRVKAAGLNPVDWKIQEYGHLIADDQYPVVLGSDIAGDVVELGEGVDEAQRPKGTRVYFQGRYGPIDRAGFQQYSLIAVDMAAKIPSNLSYSQAASISVAFICAAYGLLIEEPIGGNLNPKLDPTIKYTGEHAFVIGGTTSVGQYAIQLLSKVLGFTTVIAYASATQTDHLKSLGATHVLDRHSVPVNDLSSAINEITHAPLKFVFDAHGGDEARQVGFSLLGEGGRVCCVNSRLAEKKENGKREFGVLGIVHLPSHRAAGVEVMRKLEKWVEEGVIIPNRIHELPVGLDKIVDGLAIVKGGKAGGAKVVGHPED